MLILFVSRLFLQFNLFNIFAYCIFIEYLHILQYKQYEKQVAIETTSFFNLIRFYYEPTQQTHLLQ